MRNRGNGRVDALYALTGYKFVHVETGEETYFLNAFWGPWAGFRHNEYNLVAGAGIRMQPKVEGDVVDFWRKYHEIMEEKYQKGYVIQPEWCDYSEHFQFSDG